MITIDWTPTAEEIADARIVASALDLLAALEEFVREGYSEERALAAIAKAKGAA